MTSMLLNYFLLILLIGLIIYSGWLRLRLNRLINARTPAPSLPLALMPLFEHAPMPLIMTRMSDKKILFVNRMARDLYVQDLHWNPVGHSIIDFYVNPEDRKRLLDHLQECGNACNQEVQIQLPDGQVIWALVSASLFKFDGETVTLAGFTDISPLKKLEDQLKQLAITDELTAIYNRRYFLSRATDEYRRAERYQSPLSMLLLDIDHFKSVNDTYGHSAGDLIIQKVIGIITQHLRSSDLPGRLGGEEFAVLLPETEIKSAAILADRIRRVCMDTVIVLPCGASIQVTLSIGVAEQLPQDQDFSWLLRRADSAMYQGKQWGRNCAVCSTDAEDGFILASQPPV